MDDMNLSDYTVIECVELHDYRSFLQLYVDFDNLKICKKIKNKPFIIHLNNKHLNFNEYYLVEDVVYNYYSHERYMDYPCVIINSTYINNIILQNITRKIKISKILS